MDGALRKVEELENAISVIVDIMRDLGGDGPGDNIATSTIFLKPGGFSFVVYARDGMIRIETGDDGHSLSFERRMTDV